MAHAADRAVTPTLIIRQNGHETIVASAVATEAPYSADSSGKADASAAIQAALDAVAAVNGGVVFLPAGRYRLEHPLRLGYGTTLQGERNGPHDFDGTVLLAYTGHGDEDGPALIQVPPHRETGVIGIAIYYPEQQPAAIVPYPFAIAGGGTTLRSITLCNAYNGIELEPANGSVVAYIHGTVLRRGIAALNSTEFSWMRGVRFGNGTWHRARETLDGTASTDVAKAAVDAFTKANLAALELGRLDALAIDGFHVDASTTRCPVLVRKRSHVEQHRVFGFGGILKRVDGIPEVHGWDPWYYRMHCVDLKRVPGATALNYSGSRLPDPGRVSPDAFVSVTDEPYRAAGNGLGDDTEALARALADMGAAGGGIVYLPQGEYRVTAPLTVPSGVELRGPLGQGKIRLGRETCTLAGYAGRGAADPESAPALLTLQAHSGVRGFSIVYPDQAPDPDDLVSYPYAIRGAGAGVWIVDMHLLNAACGIDLASHRCDEHLVRDLWGTAFFKGISVGGGSENGRLERLAFSHGPWAEAGRLGRTVRTPERTKKLAAFCHEHSVHYTFGDCVGEQGWGLVGFYPRYHFHFAEQDGGVCRDAAFFLSMHDVARETCLKLDAGGTIDLVGYFATGGRDRTHNWFEVSPRFTGPLRVYGKTIEPSFVNHPLAAGPEVVQFHDEMSLWAIRRPTATATAEGSDPRYAVDSNPRTWWKAPAGAVLDIGLRRDLIIDRVTLVSAGRFLDLSLNTVRAELLVSMDGTTYERVAELNARPGGERQPHTHSWIDIPVIPPVRARDVRLRVTDPGADGTIRIAEFRVDGTGIPGTERR